MICTLRKKLKTFLPKAIISIFPQVRNGLGQFEMGERKFHHAFDAFAKLTSIDIDGNQTLFQTRFVKSRFWEDSKSSNSIAPYVMFDTPVPDFNYLEKAQALMHGIDNTNVNVYQFGDDMVAMSDFWHLYTFDFDNLETLGRVEPDLPVSRSWAATNIPLPSTSHPVQEYNSSSYISFVSYINPIPFFSSQLHVIRITSAQERETITTIQMDRIPYMHSLGLSKNYALIFADPLYVNLMTIMKTVDASESLEWQPWKQTKIYIVNIHTKEIITLDTEPAVHMHFVNAYETGKHKNRLVVDYIVYPDIDFLKNLHLDTLRNSTIRNKINAKSTLVRYKINLKRKVVKRKELKSRTNYSFADRMDFPAINEHYKFEPYCYVYGLSLKSDHKNLAHTSIVKKNLCQRGQDTHFHRENHYQTEPIFVPSPFPRSEDEGVLLSVSLDGEKKQSYVAVLDAKTLSPLSSIYLPYNVPYSLHGKFFAK